MLPFPLTDAFVVATSWQQYFLVDLSLPSYLGFRLVSLFLFGMLAISQGCAGTLSFLALNCHYDLNPSSSLRPAKRAAPDGAAYL